jgi:chemotaxis protein histidine kinase CheA
MSLDKEIVEEFLNESKSLIDDLVDLLESIEGDFSQVKKLADYGNNVDRIMGGAKSLALMAPPEHAIHLIADYSALCKAVGYKASQITDNEKFFDICVAILLDATETLQELLNKIYEDISQLKEEIPEAFLERLRWVSQQFNESYSMSVGLGKADAGDPGKMKQSEIDDLLKKLGL